MPQLFIIGGPNGAGKTTSAMVLLPDILKYSEYVNADAIAHGLSPFQPEKVAIQAGRLMLERINLLLEQKKDFAFESTLASRSFVSFLKRCKIKGYSVNMLFLWIHSVDLAIERVRDRVKRSGHNIPENVIIRRYHRGLSNFIKLYVPLADNWILYDNSKERPKEIAQGHLEKKIVVHDEKLWQSIQEAIR